MLDTLVQARQRFLMQRMLVVAHGAKGWFVLPSVAGPCWQAQ